jgi:hypothetical protein
MAAAPKAFGRDHYNALPAAEVGRLFGDKFATEELVTAIIHVRQSCVETTGASTIFAFANVALGHKDIGGVRAHDGVDQRSDVQRAQEWAAARHCPAQQHPATPKQVQEQDGFHEKKSPDIRQRL